MATALLAAAEQCADRGARKLSLRAFSTNPEAIRLYTRFGFEQEGVLRAEFLIEGQYVNDILLAKYLTGPPADQPAMDRPRTHAGLRRAARELGRRR